MNNDQLYQQIKAKRAYPGLHQFVHKWSRQQSEVWELSRKRVWNRDKGYCQSPANAAPKLRGICKGQVTLEECHIDHIVPLSSGGSNHASNLRTLCFVCHALRADFKHKSMRDKMLKTEKLSLSDLAAIWEF